VNFDYSTDGQVVIRPAKPVRKGQKVASRFTAPEGAARASA
jgi:hypothetical protein